MLWFVGVAVNLRCLKPEHEQTNITTLTGLTAWWRSPCGRQPSGCDLCRSGKTRAQQATGSLQEDTVCALIVCNSATVAEELEAML